MESPTRPAQSYFYKYASPANLRWLRDLLLTHHLYFPTVIELNDPAEGKPRIAKSSEASVRRFIVRMYRRNNPNASLDEIAAYSGRAAQGISVHGVDWVHREMTKLLHQELTGTRVYSMSRRWNNMAMWAKYGGDHKGYCIEFANDGLFKAARDVKYGDSIALDLDDDDQMRAAFFFFKKEDWSNEEEVRLIGSRLWPALMPFDPHLLTRVILGKDMSQKDQDDIRSWLKRRKPTTECVELAYDSYEGTLRMV